MKYKIIIFLKKVLSELNLNYQLYLEINIFNIFIIHIKNITKIII